MTLHHQSKQLRAISFCNVNEKKEARLMAEVLHTSPSEDGCIDSSGRARAPHRQLPDVQQHHVQEGPFQRLQLQD